MTSITITVTMAVPMVHHNRRGPNQTHIGDIGRREVTACGLEWRHVDACGMEPDDAADLGSTIAIIFSTVARTITTGTIAIDGAG